MPERSRHLRPNYSLGVPAMQFRIALEDVEPVVWRRVQVAADASFWTLHCALNDAMGWNDSHLHEFEVLRPITRELAHIGIPGFEDEADVALLAGWSTPLAEFLRTTGVVFRYLYDFGDGWAHEVQFEAIVPRPARAGSRGLTRVFPRVVGGERACPPEDCGGPGGYAHLLEVLRDESHPEHRELKRCAPRGFDPERFDAKKVKFHDAELRLQQVLSRLNSR